MAHLYGRHCLARRGSLLCRLGAAVRDNVGQQAGAWRGHGRQLGEQARRGVAVHLEQLAFDHKCLRMPKVQD